MSEEFISEPIEPVAGTFDTTAMTRGEPGLPERFKWRDKEYIVADVLEAWKELGPCRNGGNERYLRKHWFRIKIEGGLEMTVYFERQARSKRQNKVRWWLYTVSRRGKKMDEITAICGLICSECGAFIATLNDDDAKRAEVARLWSKQYNHNIEPADINCLGCISDSDCLFNHCRVCEIRKCAKEKQVVNCAYCDDYACEKLEGFFQVVPDARKHLDAIRDAC